MVWTRYHILLRKKIFISLQNKGTYLVPFFVCRIFRTLLLSVLPGYYLLETTYQLSLYCVGKGSWSSVFLKSYFTIICPFFLFHYLAISFLLPNWTFLCLMVVSFICQIFIWWYLSNWRSCICLYFALSYQINKMSKMS